MNIFYTVCKMRIFGLLMMVEGWPSPSYVHNSFPRNGGDDFPERKHSKIFTQEDIDPGDLDVAVRKLWAHSATFTGSGREEDIFLPTAVHHPCKDDALLDEEPWKTVCKNPHQFCEPGVPEKWNTWYEQRFNIPGNKKDIAAKKYGKIKNAYINCGLIEPDVFGGAIGVGIGCDQVDFQGARAAGKLSSILRVPNRWYFPGYSRTQKVDKTGVVGQQLQPITTESDRKYYFGCFTEFQAAHILLFGGYSKARKEIAFNTYRNELAPGPQVNAVTGQKMLPLATGMMEFDTGRKFWLTSQDGPLDCTGTGGIARDVNFKSLTGDVVNYKRDAGIDLWNPHFWEDYQDVIDQHLPFHSANHPRKIFFNATEREMLEGDQFAVHRYKALTQKLTPWPNSDPVQRFRFGNDNYFARSTGTTDDSIQGGDAFNRRGVTWDENLQMLSNPFRLLYESNGNIYTWLKYKNRIGPIMVADNPTDQGNTAMGNSTHFMADWAPWEKRLVTTNFPASGFIGGPSLYLQQVQPRTTWRSFEMEYTTEKKTTTKHCYSHVYVPENATYNEWSTPACDDPRGCLSVKMNINPCIWDLKWMSENSGAPSVDSNITFPRPGTWDSATRTFTFSGGNAAAYPLEKIKIEEPLTVGGKSTSFSCDSGAGWYGKSMTDPTATSDQIVDFRYSDVGEDVRITYENAISQARNPLRPFVLGIGPRFSARSHFGINPGRKRRQADDRPDFAQDLSYVLMGDTELAANPFKLQRRNQFLDHVREGGWFPLSTRMYLWPVESATPAPQLYQNVNISLYPAHTVADYWGRRYDATLDRAIWPMEYSFHSYTGWFSNNNGKMDWKKVKDLDMTAFGNATQKALPVTKVDAARQRFKLRGHSGVQLVEYLYPNYFDESQFTWQELQWMHYGAFEYIFGSNPDWNMQWIGHNSVFVGLSNILTLEDTWDLRYPLCTGSDCPDSCAAGTTASLLLDCSMAIDMRKFTEKGLQSDKYSANLHTDISLKKDPNSCHYDIQILTDCNSYIGVFADFEDDETKAYHSQIAANYETPMMPLNDPSVIFEDYSDRDARMTTTTTISTTTTTTTTQESSASITHISLLVSLLSLLMTVYI